MRMALSLVNRYTQRLQRAPYSTKMATSCFIFSASDFVCQRYVEKKDFKDYSYARTFRQAMLATLFFAPTLHVWHSKLIPFVTKSIKSKFRTIATSYVLGEGLLSPYCLTSALFLFEYLRSHDVNSGVKNVQEKFWPTLMRSYQFWGIISLFTYSVIPIHVRPVFTNCWSFLWQIYMSNVSNSNIQIEEERDEDIIPSIQLA